MSNEKATARPWEIFEGGNFVKIGAQGYVEWTERKHYLGGPLSVAEMEYNATESYRSNHAKALANAKLIVTAVNERDALLAEVGRLREALAKAAIPYEAILMDGESRRWIAPEVWAAIETAVMDARAALSGKKEGEGNG
jgi:hypothetical protein